MSDFRLDPTIAYDVIPLPSQGIYYPNKKKNIKIAFLTASDENILSSPSLIANNLVVDELLKRKVLDKDINVEDIVEEDRQAILFFLRNTAFGSDYEVIATDPKTDETFTTKVDLSNIKIKDFTLKEDVNGEYEFYLPVSKFPITFNFLTKKQEDDIKKIEESWNGNGIAPIKTKELEFLIKSINGIKDPMQLRNFIEKMPIRDSQEFRKFIKENKPGLDLSQKVITPSGEEVQVNIGFGVEFFRPFYGI
jgi:hypothetical protein